MASGWPALEKRSTALRPGTQRKTCAGRAGVDLPDGEVNLAALEHFHDLNAGFALQVDG